MVLEPERTVLLAEHQSKVVLELETAGRKVAAGMGDTSREWALAPACKGEKTALAPARKGEKTASAPTQKGEKTADTSQTYL
jgi:hypothetical protein